MNTQRWQPIETAPKTPRNGESFAPRILLLRRDGLVRIGRWIDDRYAKRRPRPFWSDDDMYRVQWARKNPPTHWMPLPEPPEE